MKEKERIEIVAEGVPLLIPDVKEDGITIQVIGYESGRLICEESLYEIMMGAFEGATYEHQEEIMSSLMAVVTRIKVWQQS